MFAKNPVVFIEYWCLLRVLVFAECSGVSQGAWFLLKDLVFADGSDAS